MPKRAGCAISTSRLRELLRAHEGHDPLDVESRGRRVTIFTIEDGQKVPLARLTMLPRGDYGLSLMWHNGRWERLPVVGTAAEVLDVLIRDFAELLASPNGASS